MLKKTSQIVDRVLWFGIGALSLSAKVTINSLSLPASIGIWDLEPSNKAARTDSATVLPRLTFYYSASCFWFSAGK